VIKLIILTILLSSCATKKLLKKSGPVAKEFRFYDFTEKPGIVFHRKCKKKKGKDRKCKITELDIIKEWDMFYHGKYLLVPENNVL